MADKEKADTMEQDVTSEQPQADKPVSDKADEATLEGKVADLEKHEAKEAEQFDKLAEEHKNLEKGDSMEKEIKEEKEVKEEKADEATQDDKEKADSDMKEKADEASISNINKGVGNSWSEEGKKEAYLNITAQGDTIEEAEEKLKEEAKKMSVDEEIIVDDYFNDDDKEREEVLKKIIENADEGVKVPAIGNTRFKASALIKRFAKANSELVPDKFKGMVEKIDSSTSELNNELLNGMFENIKAKQEEARASAMSKQGSGLFSRFTDI